jgi:predicted dehydrogenase
VNAAVLGLGSAGTRLATIFRDAGLDVIGFDPSDRPTPARVRRAESEQSAIDAASVVVVATPSSLHEKQALRALEAGRDVFIEKPVALDLAGARRVAEAADAAGRICAVGFNLRFHPALELIGRLVQDGELGDILFARASFGYDLRRWRPDADYRTGYSAIASLGGGILLDAVHELDYLVELLGAAREVSASLQHLSDLETDVEDSVVAWVGFHGGSVATLDLNAFEPAYRRGCTIAGTNATATWDWNEERVVVARDDSQTAHATPVDFHTTYERGALDFLGAVERRSTPKVSARAALAAMALLDACRLSDRERRVVDVEATG